MRTAGTGGPAAGKKRMCETGKQQFNTYMDLYEEGKKRLSLAHVREYEIDARYLLLFVYGIDMNEMLMNYATPFDETKIRKTGTYFEAVGRRAQRIPLQQITHTQNFCGYEFHVDEHVLIPRLDTEVLVEETLKSLKETAAGYQKSGRKMPSLSLLDLCTGSGCIAVVLKKQAPFLAVTAADISAGALEIAQANAAANEAEISFVRSDMFAGLSGKKYDIITCNPPYIKSSVIEMLAPEVKDHEPRLALDGAEDGLKFYRILAAGLKDHLNPGGKVLLEIGFDQAAEVSALLQSAGFRDVRVIKDLARLDRVVTAE